MSDMPLPPIVEDPIVSRIEQALNRIEMACDRLADRRAAPPTDLFASADSGVARKHAKLKAEVATAITDLDIILRGANA